MQGFSFSEGLINDTIAYYKTRGEDISSQTAHEYLLAMSDLYESLMAFAAFEPAPTPEAGARLCGDGSGGAGVARPT